jgi:hypothetical protein
MGRLKEHFDDDAIVELTALVAFQNMSSKFNGALAVPPQGFCRLPDSAGFENRAEPTQPGARSRLFVDRGERS